MFPLQLSALRTPAALMLGLFLGATVPAFAQESVSVPWGDWLADATGLFVPAVPLIATGLVYLLAKSPLGMFVALGGKDRFEQLAEQSIHFGINSVRGAVRGKTLDFDAGSAVLNKAVIYAIKHAPDFLEKFFGPDWVELVAEKIWSRLPLGEDVEAPDFSLIAANATIKAGL